MIRGSPLPFRVGIVFTCVLLLGAQAYCGQGRAVVTRFPLTSCPDTSFSLPRRFEKLPNRYRAVENQGYICSNFTVYESDPAAPPLAFGARLNPGPSCSLELGFTYIFRRDDEARALQYEVESQRAIDSLALLILQGTEVGPIVSSARTQRIDAEQVDAWCADSTPAAGRQ